MPHFRKFSGIALLAVLVTAGCRQDMHDQPRFKPLAESTFFTDLRSARPPAEIQTLYGRIMGPPK